MDKERGNKECIWCFFLKGESSLSIGGLERDLRGDSCASSDISDTCSMTQNWTCVSRPSFFRRRAIFSSSSSWSPSRSLTGASQLLFSNSILGNKQTHLQSIFLFAPVSLSRGSQANHLIKRKRPSWIAMNRLAFSLFLSFFSLLLSHSFCLTGNICYPQGSQQHQQRRHRVQHQTHIHIDPSSLSLSLLSPRLLAKQFDE